MFKFNRKEKGQGLVEYALILVLVAVVVIVVISQTGEGVCNVYAKVVNSFPDQYYICDGVSSDYSWNNDVFTEQESCTNMGADPGTTIYVWAPPNPQTGDTFYHTSVNEPPKPGFVVLQQFVCD